MITPSVDESWGRIEAWLAQYAPASHAGLRPPALPQDIQEAERRLGLTFPPDLKESLLRHDGVELQDGTPQLGYYGPLSGVADIVSSTEFLRDIGEDLAEDEAEYGYDEDENDELAYWPHERLLVTLGIGWQSSDGLFLACRPGPNHGRVGRYFDEDAPSFTPWPGLRHVLADYATALETGTPFNGRTPLAFQGVLIWEDETATVPEPVSPLALAAEAVEPEPERPVEAEPSTPRPDGAYVAITFMQTDAEPEIGQPDVVFVHGIAPAELAQRLGTIPATARPRSREEARLSAGAPWAGHRPMVRIGTAGSWSYATQEGGDPQFGRPELLRRLSKDTRAVTLTKRGPQVRVSLVEDGAPRPDAGREVDSPREDYRTGPDGQEYQVLYVDPWPGSTAAYAHLLAGLEEAYGIAWRPEEDGEEPLASALLLPVLDEHDASARPEPSWVRDFDLGELVARTTPEQLRAVVAGQLVRLAAETGIDTYPEVSRALERIGRDEPVELPADGPLELRMRTLAAETHAARKMLDTARYRCEESPVTQADFSAWALRDGAVRALRDFVLLPTPTAAASILHQRLSARWRDDLMADLAEQGAP
ncbi:SMI1/KNR4 family protein [Streptomyces sp. NPDC051183]|uniref:SMI1/KNR4 family protein n=1 Tax=Streptomyces sp. NPDC051183 TaxID=3155165 RepID=UPI003442250C